MLKRLRIKFIVLNMVTVGIVLVAVFTIICIIDYQQSMDRVSTALDTALTHVDDDPAGPWQEMDPADQAGEGSEGENAALTGEATPPEIGGRRGGTDPLIPVAVYVTSDDGTLTALQTMMTASIADDVLEQAYALLVDSPDGFGSLDALGLYYKKSTVGQSTYFAFVDMSTASNWQSLAFTLAGVGIAALLVFFVISLFFSRWALRPVKEAWTQQQRFVADASHELKTPLTVVLANTSILMEHPERSVASQSQWIESTQTEAERMQELVADLLFLARPDADSPVQKRSYELINLSDFVEGDVLQFESVAFERCIAIEQSLDDQVLVRGDAVRLHRLISTLLDNACKYVNENGTITVTLRQTIRDVRLSVHNTGPAISPDDLPHVFDRFYRADKARSRDIGGYGLGLAIAREVIEEHDGTISVTSTADKGTTFAVSLPPASKPLDDDTGM